MTKPLLIAYVQQWHMNRSDAFYDLLTEPMRPYAKVEMRGWDGVSPLPSVEDGQHYVFCQLPPPAEWLQKVPDQLIWLPMWDSAIYYSQTWWNSLPKSLRIVAFSEAVHQLVISSSLKSLNLKFFKDPQIFTSTNWTGDRILLYWNRTGLIGPQFLEHLCGALKVDKLLFRSQADPDYIDSATYQLPSRLGRTVVETLPVFQTRQAYFDATREANVFIAPRLAEGVGMSFLEAMARGCAVFAHDRATMSEYIASGENGYLFKRRWTVNRVLRGIRGKLAQSHIGSVPPFMFTLRETDQDWHEIASLDLEHIGQVARQQHQLGYQNWQRQIPQYAQFLLDS